MAMSKGNGRSQLRQAASSLAVALCGLAITECLTGCLMIGGTSRGGFFIWPGSIGMLFVIVLVVMLLRRR